MFSCSSSHCRLGEVDEVVGVVGHPYKQYKGAESLAHALLRFKDGRLATLYCHYMDIAMTTLPFFQIFGPEVGVSYCGEGW